MNIIKECYVQSSPLAAFADHGDKSFDMYAHVLRVDGAWRLSIACVAKLFNALAQDCPDATAKEVVIEVDRITFLNNKQLPGYTPIST